MSAWSLFFALTGVATAGWSVYVCILLLTETCAAHSQLEYISTRLAHCLDARTAEVWSLVFCVEFQIALLLIQWRRLLHSYHFVTALRPWIISTGVSFVANFAMVVEFRNDSRALSRTVLGIQFKEADLHAYAAVVTMSAFTVLHALLCWSLLALSKYEAKLTLTADSARSARGDGYRAVDFQLVRPDAEPVRPPAPAHTPAASHSASHSASPTASPAASPAAAAWALYRKSLVLYAELDWVYFMCIIVFFVAWALNNSTGPLYSTAVYTEWTVLAVAALMHAYALAQSHRPLTWLPDEPEDILAAMLSSMRAAWRCSVSWRDTGLAAFFTASLVYTLLIFTFAPLAATDAADAEHLHSSALLLLAVLSAYACGALLLMT